MNFILIGAIGLVAIGVVLAIIFFVFRAKKKGGMYDFLLYNRGSPGHCQIIQAQLQKDPENPYKKIFYFPQYDCHLPVQAPSHYINGRGYREVIPDDKNDLTYLTTTIEKDDYVKKSLTPQEKELALYMYKEASRAYENPMNKTQAMLLISNFIMLFIVVAGTIYVSVTQANTVPKYVDLAKENNKVVTAIGAEVETLELMVGQLSIISSHLINESIVRRIG